MKAVTPDLIKSGKILESEAWMGSSLTTISDSLTACKKEFAVQLLENTNTTISELSSFDTCSTDVTAISKCLSAQRVAAPAPASAPASGNGMAGEVLSEACAVSVSGSSNATDCPSPAAARVVAGVPVSSGKDTIFAPFDETSVLKISADNTRGRITWRANCWCDNNWDTVCDADTRKQYPNACSAQCQVRGGAGLRPVTAGCSTEASHSVRLAASGTMVVHMLVDCGCSSYDVCSMVGSALNAVVLLAHNSAADAC